jgi:amino acid adenylation domain-containing protein
LIIKSTLNNLIAVFYTSGSTGKPKGVMINGIGFLNLCLWYKEYYEITESAKVLLLFAFSFDASFKNIMTPLLTGGQTVLINSYDPLKLLTEIERQKITIINTTPSLFYPILDLAAHNNYQNLLSLQYLSLGGEPMVFEKIKPWLKSKFCNCQLINLYGPSESSDVSTVYKVSKERWSKLISVPIGKPINNLSVYILDKNNNLQPPGLVGELCVSGEIIARGYLNRPDLTAEKFIQNPFVDGQRIYKTGDMARWLPDENLECLGRIDHQVKLRGLRIEVEEIETVLRQHTAVRQAVVIMRGDVFKEKCLVAYLVTNDQTNFSLVELRTFLSKKLPVFMLPSAFVRLETLPLNPNGKVDRRALPVPDTFRLSLQENYVAPSTPLEKVTAGVWAEALGIEHIGLHDNFFELGGQSLLAIKVISQLRNLLRVELPLYYIFESPTVFALTTAILQNPEKKWKIEKNAQLLMSITKLSDDEVEAILNKKLF